MSIVSFNSFPSGFPNLILPLSIQILNEARYVTDYQWILDLIFSLCRVLILIYPSTILKLRVLLYH